MAFLEDVRSSLKYLSDPSHEIWVGLIFAILCVGLALTGLIRLHRSSQKICPLGPCGAGPSQISEQTALKDSARLTIAFDNGPSVLRQDGVRCYHWYGVPAVAMDWSSRKVSKPPGYMLIFVEFTDPTHTENCRVRVDDGSSDARVLTTSSTGAVVRAMGDMQGKTIDIRFSKDRIVD